VDLKLDIWSLEAYTITVILINDDWQQYAAVVAAAYTRVLIEPMP
jgi:hypothetical protein